MSRLLLLVFILLTVLAACGGSSDDQAPNRAVHFLTTSANITPQQNRFTITVRQGGDVVAMTVRARDPDDVIQWEGAATLYTDYPTPYWVVYPEFNGPGLWQLDIAAETDDGATLAGALLASVAADAGSIVPGMAAPQSETLTLDDGLPLLRMTTDTTPNEDFYRLTVAEAVTSGEPSLIVFATPGLCSNTICAPVMDTTIERLYDLYGDDLNFVHVEIYNLQTSEYVPAMAEWGLSFEPWTFLVDGAGVVVSRYDGPLGVSEIQPDIEALISSG